MHILMVLEGSFPPDVRVEKEIGSLLEAGYSITLLCTTRSLQPRFEAHTDFIIKRRWIPSFIYRMRAYALTFPFYFWWWHHTLGRELAQEKYDAIHLHDLPLIKVVEQFANRYHLPLIADWHENLPEIMKLYRHTQRFPGNRIIKLDAWKRYEKRYASLAYRLILVTREAQKYYEGHYIAPEGNIRVVPNYVDFRQIDAVEPNPVLEKQFNGRFTVVYVGDTGLRRGIMTLLLAAQKLPDVIFCIVGSSKEQSFIEDWVRKHRLKNVLLPGWVDFTTAIQYIKAGTVGVCPLQRNIHHDTTYANKIFQYMACGKPQIVSDCPAQKQVVENAGAGMSFPAEDVDAFIKCIEIMRASTDIDQMGEKARKAVEERYNWTSAAFTLTGIYHELDKR